MAKQSTVDSSVKVFGLDEEVASLPTAPKEIHLPEEKLPTDAPVKLKMKVASLSDTHSEKIFRQVVEKESHFASEPVEGRKLIGRLIANAVATDSVNRDTGAFRTEIAKQVLLYFNNPKEIASLGVSVEGVKSESYDFQREEVKLKRQESVPAFSLNYEMQVLGEIERGVLELSTAEKVLFRHLCAVDFDARNQLSQDGNFPTKSER